jgi:hypothetical protein
MSRAAAGNHRRRAGRSRPTWIEEAARDVAVFKQSRTDGGAFLDREDYGAGNILYDVINAATPGKGPAA